MYQVESNGSQTILINSVCVVESERFILRVFYTNLTSLRLTQYFIKTWDSCLKKKN